MTTGKRDPYREVGEATRHAIGAVIDSRATRLEHRVFLAVVWLTCTYSKLSDATYLARVASIAYGVEEAKPWQLEKTRKALVMLRDLGAIEVTAPRGRPSAGPRYRVGLPVNPAREEAGQGQEESSPGEGRPSDVIQPGAGLRVAQPDSELIQPDSVANPARNQPGYRPLIQPGARGPTEKVSTEALAEGRYRGADGPPGIGSADPSADVRWWGDWPADGDTLSRMIATLAPIDAPDMSHDLDALAIDKHLHKHLTALQRQAVADLMVTNQPADVRHVLKVARSYTDEVGYEWPRLALPKRDQP